VQSPPFPPPGAAVGHQGVGWGPQGSLPDPAPTSAPLFAKKEKNKKSRLSVVGSKFQGAKREADFAPNSQTVN
jgi:hypothetical protein